MNDYLTRPAAQLGLMMMGHCTAREAEEFFGKVGGMTPSASTLQRLTVTMQERWERLGPETLDGIREAEDIPQDAVTASVSLDGVMVALRAGEDGRAEASWREAACGTVSFHDAEGERLKTIYLGRMPESGKPTLKAQLASEVAHIRRLRPELGIVAVADGRRRQLDLPGGPQGPRPRSSTSGMPASISAWPQTTRWRPTGSRSTARSCVTTPAASPR